MSDPTRDEVELAARRVRDGWHMARKDAPQEDAVILLNEVRRLTRLLAQCSPDSKFTEAVALLRDVPTVEEVGGEGYDDGPYNMCTHCGRYVEDCDKDPTDGSDESCWGARVRAFLAPLSSQAPVTCGTCGTCKGAREVLFVYARGPGDLPGNAMIPCPECAARPTQEAPAAKAQGVQEGTVHAIGCDGSPCWCGAATQEAKPRGTLVMRIAPTPEMRDGKPYCPGCDGGCELCRAAPPQEAKPRGVCTYCAGRGWHVGECHPQETCGGCNGTGLSTPAAPPQESGTAPTPRKCPDCGGSRVVAGDALAEGGMPIDCPACTGQPRGTRGG